MTPDHFYSLVDRFLAGVCGHELVCLGLRGEDSDFVRFNQSKVRQAGKVSRTSAFLSVVAGNRVAHGTTDLAGKPDTDLARLNGLLKRLRNHIPHLDPDPYINYPDSVHDTHSELPRALPESARIVDLIIRAAARLDLTGILANGILYAGFANSQGQRNWHSTANFNLDWTCHGESDSAVKNRYAGVYWQDAVFLGKLQNMTELLTIAKSGQVRLDPGLYRVYFGPAAVRDIVSLLGWDGFGLRSHRTAQTPLLKMTLEGRRLHPVLSLREVSHRGLTPSFTVEGFPKPRKVSLIEGGRYRNCLVCARSGKEYGASVNCDLEYPESLEMDGGTLQESDLLRRLGNGLFVDNLWYGNFSDRRDCRITAMTRFATLLVKNGEPHGMVSPMRLDDSVYRLFGDKLVDLSAKRELILDAGTYDQRSWASYLLPGALVEEVRFTA